MQPSICYDEDQHQVWLHKKEHSFLQLVDRYARCLANLVDLLFAARAKVTALLSDRLFTRLVVGHMDHLTRFGFRSIEMLGASDKGER